VGPPRIQLPPRADQVQLFAREHGLVFDGLRSYA
jgi:hypothetical protein